MATRIGSRAIVVLSAALAGFALLLALAPAAHAEVKKFPAAGTLVWSNVTVRKAPSPTAARKVVIQQMRVDGRPQIVHATTGRRIGAVEELTASTTLKNSAGLDAVRFVARVGGAEANRYRLTIAPGSAEGRAKLVMHDGPSLLFDNLEYAEGSVSELVGLVNGYSLPVKATLLADGTPLAQTAQSLAGGRDGNEGTLWYKLNLPIRPFGQTGWIPADAVEVRPTTKLIVIHRRAKYLEVKTNGRRVFRAPIATGRSDRPTPLGNFYVAAKYRPPTNAAVSAYALELSAPAGLPDFLKGGVVGIHGTPLTSTIGKNASNGCIRVHNSTVLRLKSLIPLGTPVKIVA